jgi:hypothetical protein
MRHTLRLLLAVLGLAGHAATGHADTGINLNGSMLWATDDKLYINGVGVGGLENYDAGFQWDAATSSFRLIAGSVAVSGYRGTPYCPTMRFVDMTADGASRVYLNADLLVDGWSRTMQLTLAYESANDTPGMQGSFSFRPAYLRLVQNGRSYTLTDISSTANPHFVPGNGWLPNLEPLSQNNYSTAATIVDFPAGFDLTRTFYVYYGSGTPAAPAADGNDTYYYCTAN